MGERLHVVGAATYAPLPVEADRLVPCLLQRTGIALSPLRCAWVLSAHGRFEGVERLMAAEEELVVLRAGLT